MIAPSGTEFNASAVVPDGRRLQRSLAVRARSSRCLAAAEDNARVAYDEVLADRVRELVLERGVTEQRMFGGVGIFDRRPHVSERERSGRAASAG